MHKIMHTLTKIKVKSVLGRYYCLEGETYWRDITAWKVRHIGEILLLGR
jgi:bisphosphoglycerate-independent phosphoglycerate mutase (AlkP superfamily)